MKDKICLITGATDGIGKEIAKSLAKLGAEIIYPSRNVEKGEMVKKEIISETGNERISFLPCDLASLQSVSEFSRAVKEKYSRLDVLVNNAGFSGFKRRLSHDNIEYTFAVNHLAPFLMTNLLLDVLKNSPQARIITVSADVHKHGTIDFDDLEKEHSYSLVKSYCQSKLANILFTKQLALHLKGTRVTANCLLPGQATTTLIKDGNPFFNMLYQFSRFMKVKRFSAEFAAQTPIFLATSPEVENTSGECFKRKKIVRSSRESYDMDIARRLWEVSEQYVKKYLSE